jgi:hypothetical protein
MHKNNPPCGHVGMEFLGQEWLLSNFWIIGETYVASKNALSDAQDKIYYLFEWLKQKWWKS